MYSQSKNVNARSMKETNILTLNVSHVKDVDHFGQRSDAKSSGLRCMRSLKCKGWTSTVSLFII